MKPAESAGAFERFAAARGIDVRTSTPRAGIEAMLAFRAASACATCAEDVLLYQWGSWDWGAGKHFELNITRQFIETSPDDDEDDAISQLSLTYRYRPTAAREGLGAGDCWEDGPMDLREFILASAAFLAVADEQAEQVALSHFYV